MPENEGSELYYTEGRRLDYPVFDADNHMYENTDAMTKFIPREYDGIVKYVEFDRRSKLALKDRITRNITNPTFVRVSPPGGQQDDPEHRRAINGLDEFFDVEPRFRLMQDIGLDRSIMWPTLVSVVENNMYDDPMGCQVVLHALNEWMHEHWTYNYKDAIFATPVINLSILDGAMKELECILERGCKVFLLRPAPVDTPYGRRSFALPMFDPFWEAVQEADVLVGMHASIDTRYRQDLQDLEGPHPAYLTYGTGTNPAFQMLTQTTWQIADVCASIIGHGLLTRFPRLRLAPVELGTQWVRPFFERMESAWDRAPQMFDENPVEAFRRNVFVHAFREPDPVGLTKVLGVENTMFGSDFPHPEGLREPLNFADLLTDLPVEDQAKVMGGNLARIMKVDDSVRVAA
jgi:predicted TIM-barrel fold metal-dependent hydrolase